MDWLPLDQIASLATAVGAAGVWRNYEVARRNRGDQVRVAPTSLKVVSMLAMPGPMDEMVRIQRLDETVVSMFRTLKTYVAIGVTNTGSNEVCVLDAGWGDGTDGSPGWRDPEWVCLLYTSPSPRDS